MAVYCTYLIADHVTSLALKATGYAKRVGVAASREWGNYESLQVHVGLVR